MQNPKNKFLNYAVPIIGILFGSFVFIPFNLKPTLVGLFVTYAIFSAIIQHDFSFFTSRNFWIRYLIAIGFIFPLMVSLFFSENFAKGLVIFQRLIPIILVPIAFCSFSHRQSIFLKYFYASLCISLAIYSIFITVLFYEYFFSEGYEIFIAHLIHEFWGLEEHPIYITMYYLLALVILFTEKNFSALAKVVFGLIFLFTLTLIMRKTFILSIISMLFVWLFMERKYKVIGISLTFVVALLVGISQFHFVKVRIDDIFSIFSVSKDYAVFETSSSLTREILWRTSEILIRKSYYLGYGVGDAMDVFAQQLNEYGFEKLAVERYNPHNQFLLFGLMAGFPAAILFGYSFVYFAIKSFKSNNLQGVLIVLILFSFSMIECILYRQNGAIMYAFFLSLVACKNMNKSIN